MRSTQFWLLFSLFYIDLHYSMMYSMVYVYLAFYMYMYVCVCVDVYTPMSIYTCTYTYIFLYVDRYRWIDRELDNIGENKGNLKF